MTFRLPHLLAAAVLHVLVLGLLLGGVQCSAKPHQPPVITAVLLDPSRSEQLERKRADQKKLEQRRQAEQERKRREEDAQRQRLAEEQKKAEAQKRAAAEAEAKKKKDAEALRQKQLAEKKAAELKAAEQKKAEEAARRKEEQEKAEQAAAAKREADERARVEQAMREEALRREADLEQRARAASERQARQSEWAAALQAHVQRNYLKPPGAPDEFSCQVRMQLLPDGTVTNARIVKSCGSAPLDRAVEDAVFRSSPMPRPADPSVFERDLLINFTP